MTGILSNEKKMTLAYTLYCGGRQQKDIADLLDVSAQTINAWVKKGEWEIKRAGQNLSRRSLVNKLLTTINTTIDMVNESGDIELMLRLPEKLAGFANLIGKLDNKDKVLDLIEAFNGFNTWLELQSIKDKRLTREILALIAELQEKYVDEQINDNLSN
jgi:DNA-binding Lrp family transcriptional regulator